MIQTQDGYGGMQSQWSTCITSSGYFYLNQRARRVYLVSDKIQDISAAGLEKWFNVNLAYNLEAYEKRTFEAQIEYLRGLEFEGKLTNDQIMGLQALEQAYTALGITKSSGLTDTEKEIALNKQLLQSSASVGRGYKNAGNAAVAAAQAAVSAKIQEAVMTYMAEAMTKIPYPLSLGVPILGAAMAGALGSVLSGSSSSAESNFSSTSQFAEGGYVGGRPHSQGGTIIEAERGEFVMSRNATESIGLETLNQMNQSGGGGSINVSVTGNVLTQDFVEGELAESIKEAVRRGSDFGLS